MTILDEILRVKELEVGELTASADLLDERVLPRRPTLAEQLLQANELQVIAEFKRASPSKGIIRNEVNPAIQAIQYEQAGAICISVLTDKHFFQGSFEDLSMVAKAVRIPILCKDFIIHPIQIRKAKAAGASVILLIAAALTEANFRALFAFAQSLGLEVLAEVHSEQEMDFVLAAGAQIIGVNNRDLKTFQVDLTLTEQLGAIFPVGHGRVLISESGISGRTDAARAAKAGASGVLVGEALMQKENPSNLIRSLKVCKGDGNV